MTSQQLGDIALAEHRAVMETLLRESIRRPTEEQYAEVLSVVRGVMECPEIIGSQSQSLSPAQS